MAFAEPPAISAQDYKQSVRDVDYKKHELDAKAFARYAQEKNVVVLDLRSEVEYEQSHIKGAKHLGADIDEKKLQQLLPSKDTKVLIYCRNSLSSLPTRQISLTYSSLPQLMALGYSNTYYLGDLYRQTPENEPLIRKMLTKQD